MKLTKTSVEHLTANLKVSEDKILDLICKHSVGSTCIDDHTTEVLEIGIKAGALGKPLTVVALDDMSYFIIPTAKLKQLLKRVK